MSAGVFYVVSKCRLTVDVALSPEAVATYMWGRRTSEYTIIKCNARREVVVDLPGSGRESIISACETA